MSNNFHNRSPNNPSNNSTNDNSNNDNLSNNQQPPSIPQQSPVHKYSQNHESENHESQDQYSHNQESQNPYTPPTALIEKNAQVSNEDDALRQFVGDKYFNYYRGKWFGDNPATLDNKSQKVKQAGFSLAGFFLGVLWMCYRKMYLWAIALTVGITALDIISIHLFASPKGSFDGLPTNIVWLILTGFFGNYFYFLHARKQINKIVESTHPNEVADELTKQGGTSWLGAIGVGFSIVFIMVVMYFFLTPDWFMTE